MFIGRERELNSLNRLYVSDKFEFGLLTSIPLIKDGEGGIDEKTGKPKGKGKCPNIPLLNKALLPMVDMTSMAHADTLHDELYCCIVGKKRKPRRIRRRKRGRNNLRFCVADLYGAAD